MNNYQNPQPIESNNNLPEKNQQDPNFVQQQTLMPVKQKNKLILGIIIGALISLVLAGGVAAFMFFKQGFFSRENIFRKSNNIGSTPTNAPLNPTPKSNNNGESSNNVIEANNDFAFDLYSKYESNEGNIFFSPYSISTALAMTYEGARGQTATEMQSVFHFPENEFSRRSSYRELYDQLNKKNQHYELNTANALWAEQNFKFLDEYFSVVNKFYDGKVTNLDFKQQPENARSTINNWVEDQTNNKIRNLIPLGLINDMTRLVLTNAIYFKGEWVQQFNEEQTKEQDFRVAAGNNVKIKMMQKTDGDAIFGYIQADRLQILEMPYSGEDLSMLILLPEDDDTRSLEKSLNRKKLAEWTEKLEEKRVNVYIPRFKFETKYFMEDTLSKMGMPIAFSDNADFSGMTGAKDLKISKVIHQTFIEVNEEGTEAAAATAVIMKEFAIAGPGPQIPTFRADHPFIFIIQQKETGNILFMGRVSDPNK